MKIFSARKPVWLFALIILALAQSACNYATQLMNGVPALQSGTPAPANCDNKYLLTKNGATRIFVGKSGYTEQVTISQLKANSFDEDWQTNPVDGKKSLFAYFWKCTTAGLVLTGSNNVTFSSITGVAVPVSIQAGDQWTNSYETATGTFTQNYTAIGEESVTVPAGSFTAMKIQISAVSQQNSPGPFALKTDGFEWWAAGIGKVKSSLTYTINTRITLIERELQSYSNP